MRFQYIIFFLITLSIDQIVNGFATLQPFSALKQPVYSDGTNQYHFHFLEPFPICSRSHRNSSLNASLSPSALFPHSISPSAIALLPYSGVVDFAAVIFGCLTLAVYHLLLYRVETQGNKRTWRSSQADNREEWSRFVRKTEGWLYAVQTLRNAITAQTFLSTTVLSLLTVITGRLWEIIRNLDGKSDYRKYLVTQLIMVASCMLTSAYHFLQSARLMTHAGFMFPLDTKTTKVDRIMRKTQNAQWLGLRFLYLSAAMISWVVGGPKIFLAASLLLTVFFQKIDRVPEGVDPDVNCMI